MECRLTKGKKNPYIYIYYFQIYMHISEKTEEMMWFFYEMDFFGCWIFLDASSYLVLLICCCHLWFWDGGPEWGATLGVNCWEVIQLMLALSHSLISCIYRTWRKPCCQLGDSRVQVNGTALTKGSSDKLVKDPYKPTKSHQEFQVPKIEVLNLIRLFHGWVSPSISILHVLLNLRVSWEIHGLHRFDTLRKPGGLRCTPGTPKRNDDGGSLQFRWKLGGE